MRAWPLVLLVAGILAGAGTWWLLREEPGPASDSTQTLEPLVESPRPPVRAEAVPPVLSGRAPPAAPAPEPSKPGALVETRNLRAREHARAVSLYEAGVQSIQYVEVAEMALLDARRAIDEIDEPTWRRARALLFSRAAERGRLLAESGFLSVHERDRLALLVARETQLAGDRSDYAALREALLTATKERNRRLQENGFLSSQAADDEVRHLEAEFPAPEALGSR